MNNKLNKKLNSPPFPRTPFPRTALGNPRAVLGKIRKPGKKYKPLPPTPVIVIVGPTSSGKSNLAVRLAKKFNGEVISADSRQVYKGLNIATGKITKKEMRGIPHHLLDVADPRRPNTNYSAARYLKDASKTLRDIVRRGKLPIICGGTGFYISALLGEIKLANVPPNKTLRHQLLGSEASKLFKVLKKLDPKRAKTIDRHNPVRLIRAIEIAVAGKARDEDSKFKTYDLRPPNLEASLPSWGKYKVLKIGLTLPKEELKKKIHIRLFARIREGIVAEAKRLHAGGLSYKRMHELGLEYRLLADYLQNKITKQELIERIEKENWRYAKRQMTWFKRDKEIRWFRPNDRKIGKIVKKFVNIL